MFEVRIHLNSKVVSSNLRLNNFKFNFINNNNWNFISGFIFISTKNHHQPMGEFAVCASTTQTWEFDFVPWAGVAPSTTQTSFWLAELDGAQSGCWASVGAGVVDGQGSLIIFGTHITGAGVVCLKKTHSMIKIWLINKIMRKIIFEINWFDQCEIFNFMN